MFEESNVTVNTVVTLDTILEHHIDILITEYEENIFFHLLKKQFESLDALLHDFCYILCDLPETEQHFIIRTFFTGIVTLTTHIQIQKQQLNANALATSYKTIATLHSFNYMSEFILYIPTFIDRLQDQLHDSQLIDSNNNYVHTAIQLIHERITDRLLTVQSLANELHISATYLSSMFRIYTGQTVHQYITEHKMKEIAFDIQYTNMPIYLIREKYGYENSSHFIQSFKKWKGLTPLQFQKQCLYE